MNYVVFDEALALLDQLKKSNSKIRKATTFWKQNLDNKGITRENDCLPYMCFVLLLSLALVGLEPL